jgi:hypothetical protein
MLLGRFYRFQCDTCGKTVECTILPKNWVWIKGGPEGFKKHACEVCKSTIPKEIRRPSGIPN